jgi:oxygen-independent coproporphyrinogen-3 oxidase
VAPRSVFDTPGKHSPPMSLGIYIQVPFCQSKCTYCNFHTEVFSNSLYSPYVDAVCHELLDHRSLLAAFGLGLPCCSTDVVDTVYIGGGTPSLLSPDSLARTMDSVRSSFSCRLEEVTLEADPETISPEKAAAWLAAGINRISLGVQSFHDEELKSAGRLHRREDVFAAVRLLREAGFRNLSFDLIAGLPRQTAESWQESLHRLLELRPEHVSIYLIEIDEGSRLGREVLSGGLRYCAPQVPDEDAMAAFYERACECLSAAGYNHYEISNWALPGLRSRHNLKYWRREPYLGFGAGAHSFNGRERWANAHDPAAYTAAIQSGRLPAEQRELLSERQALEEELFLGLRQLEGIDLAPLEQRYNASSPEGVSLRARLGSLQAAGLVELDGSHLRLAPSRLAVANEVFVELMD